MTIDRTQPFNLETWYPDMVKILGAKVMFRVPASLRAEVMQEICLALLHKQGTDSAYDPAQSSPATYLIMVANNVISNMKPKQKRLGRETSLEEILEDVPALLADTRVVNTDKLCDMKFKLERFESFLSSHDPALYPYYNLLKDGYKGREIEATLGGNVAAMKIRLEKLVGRFLKRCGQFEVQHVFGIQVRVKGIEEEGTNTVAA